MQRKLISDEIEAIAIETGLKETTIGQMACGDAKLHERSLRRQAHEKAVFEKLAAFRTSYRAKCQERKRRGDAA